jgi:hypothetical protein
MNETPLFRKPKHDLKDLMDVDRRQSERGLVEGLPGHKQRARPDMQEFIDAQVFAARLTLMQARLLP